MTKLKAPVKKRAAKKAHHPAPPIPDPEPDPVPEPDPNEEPMANESEEQQAEHPPAVANIMAVTKLYVSVDGGDMEEWAEASPHNVTFTEEIRISAVNPDAPPQEGGG